MFEAEQIALLRKSLGESLAAFGRRFEPPVSFEAVRKWEQGLSHPSWDNLVRLNRIAEAVNGNGHAAANGK